MAEVDIAQDPGSTPATAEGLSPATTRSVRRYVSPSLPEFNVYRDPGSAEERVVYMGDSSNMKYVIDEVGDPFRSTPQTRLWGDHLQLYMLERLGQPTREALWRLHYSNQQLLKTQGAFNSLGRRLGTDLVQSYFTYSYTHLPIFQRHDLITLHESGAGLSPLVANAVYFIGTLHCSSSTIDALGFGTRYMASTTFYRRAKALYDADCESDGLANVQAAILLSHWWGGPMDPKDTWHWLGIASGLAQSLGMHRSKSYACLQPHRRMLWRRI